MRKKDPRGRGQPEQRAIVPTRRRVDLASMPPDQEIIDASPSHTPVRRIELPGPQLPNPPAPQAYQQQSYSYRYRYREVTYWSSRTTSHSGGGMPSRPAPAGLPAAESEVGFALARGLQLIVWVGLLTAGGYFGGRILGWW